MDIVICTKENQKLVSKIPDSVSGEFSFVSPTQERAVHGAEKVVIIGDYPEIESQYQGLCPVEVIPLGDPRFEAKPKTTKKKSK